MQNVGFQSRYLVPLTTHAYYAQRKSNMTKTTNVHKKSPEDLRKLYETADAEVIRENGLIHARMNMFLTSQAFLLAAMGLAAKYKAIAYTVIFVGIASSFFTIVSILTAIHVFFRFMNIKKEILPDLREIDPHSYIDRPVWEIWAGFSGSIGIPVALFVAWLFLLLCVEFPLPIVNS
jgi:hypothetical protein